MIVIELLIKLGSGFQLETYWNDESRMVGEVKASLSF